ncbi:MAG TPA: LLM class flavin-dependent oxidoreductase [Rubrobacter sp.]|nr:LLM class flavin-dependent oxidoreductase [Rubrobacter sp.]
MDFGLSVLDVSPVSSGSNSARALRNTLDLARLADRLGYRRYWLAEHHNLPSIASSAPEVMIGHVAGVTERIRVGAGGIMLPNHAPLRVVETFRVLEALHPGRVDLGIGRAPGTDPVAATALRRSHDGLGAEDFPQRFGELLAFAGDGFPDGHPFRSVVAMPEDVGLPPIWLLGSSGYSARAAGEMGLGYAFAAHFSPADPAPAMRAYRESFEPSETFERPSAVLAVAVVCGETDEHARRIAASMELAWVRIRSGKPGPLPSPEEAMAYPYTPAERQLADTYRSMQIVGDPPSVRARIEEVAERTATDEVMVTTNVHDHAERLRSYERIAEVFDFAMPGG